jgi:predicted DNA-binding transcriptional regulator YafY
MSPTARALLALEAIQNSPGITAQRLADRLGVTQRAVRRYIAILREADLPIESVSGPYGGYRVGRGLRLPPLMFTAAEAMGLAMAVLEGHRDAADPADLVGSALAKIVRVLPERLAGPVLAVREVSVPRSPQQAAVSPELTTRLIEACSAARRLRLVYRLGNDRQREMDVDPWAVILRHSRWYLLGWSHIRQARRVLRVDRIVSAEGMPQTFMPPADLDALRALEDHLSQGWDYPVEVLVCASAEEVSRWVPRNLGRLESVGEGQARLSASTSDPDWYARQLAAIPAPFLVVQSPELQLATAALARQLAQAASDQAAGTGPCDQGDPSSPGAAGYSGGEGE